MRRSVCLGTAALAAVPFLIQAQPKPAAFTVPRGGFRLRGEEKRNGGKGRHSELETAWHTAYFFTKPWTKMAR